MTRTFTLNRQQKQAITHVHGPLLIIAGAGTGKTTVITERIKYLIQEKTIDPQNIFAATFTEKAATEMLERLDLVMPLGYQEPWLGTFHSLCDRILKLEALEIGLDPGYRIITPVEQWMLIKKHLFEFDFKYYRPLGNPTKFISALIKYFSRAQDEDTNPQQMMNFAKKKKNQAETKAQKQEAEKLMELAVTYGQYQQLKIKESMMDFGDLINQTINLFRKRNSILKKYQDLFTHVLVDEFQDTNFSQYQLIKLLSPAPSNPNLVVVGDDDQSIYKFRGASVSNILQFKKEYPKTKQVVLTKNYRSFEPIINKSYLLIQNNNPDRLEYKLKIRKKLKATRKEKFKTPLIIKADNGHNEVDFVVSKILKLAGERNYTYKDFAILTRANSHLDPFVLGLKRAGIPYQLIGNRGLFDQEEVKELLNFLQVINNPEDTPSLFHLLHLKTFSISSEIIFKLLNQARLEGKSLWKVLKEDQDGSILSLVNLIKQFQKQALKNPVSKLLYSFIFQTNYIRELSEPETVENLLKIKNINLLFDILKKFETDNQETGLADFVELLKLWQEAGENPSQAVIEDVDTVNLLTIHSAKGLEFPVVFVPSLVVGRFPAINRRDPIEFPEELIKETLPKQGSFVQEERRLFYVAMTRAQDELYLSYASDYGGVRQRQPSGFLKESKIKEQEYYKQADQTSFLQDPSPSPTINYLDDKGHFKITNISYSQIDTFLACPLKYKYRYLLKVPAEPHHALSFGVSIHNTLHQFHTYEIAGKAPNLNCLLSIYEKNFIHLGYDSEKHKKLRYRKGRQSLKVYYRYYQKLFGKPKLLEKRFRINLSGIQLIGKIDRIDETEEGLEIVDYKTGEARDQKTVDRDKQLSIYGIAAREALGLKISKMSLYYIEENLKIETIRTEKNLEKEKKYLKEITQKIKESEFPPKPGYPFPCGFCEYKRICPFASKPR